MTLNCPGCRYDAERQRERDERRRQRKVQKRKEISVESDGSEWEDEEDEREEGDLMRMVDSLMSKTFAYTKAVKRMARLDREAMGPNVAVAQRQLGNKELKKISVKSGGAASGSKSQGALGRQQKRRTGPSMGAASKRARQRPIRPRLTAPKTPKAIMDSSIHPDLD